MGSIHVNTAEYSGEYNISIEQNQDSITYTVQLYDAGVAYRVKICRGLNHIGSISTATSSHYSANVRHTQLLLYIQYTIS